jgi:hypothetical protein
MMASIHLWIGGRRLDTSPVAEVKRLVSFARWGLLASALGIAATRYWFVTSAGYLIGCAVLGGLWVCLMAIWLQPRVQTQQPLRHSVAFLQVLLVIAGFRVVEACFPPAAVCVANLADSPLRLDKSIVALQGLSVFLGTGCVLVLAFRSWLARLAMGKAREV